MAFKAFPLFCLALFVFLSLLSSDPILAAETKDKPPVEFLKHLEGSQKGDKVKGILGIKKYLEKFGYLDPHTSKNRALENDHEFDEMLESAIKTYQLNFHIKPSGILDKETLSKMEMPRCGVPDIINGTNRMKPHENSHHYHGSDSSSHIVAHYTFFPGSPRWPASRRSLTYAFLPGTRSDAIDPVVRAYQIWQANSPFRFTRIQDYRSADMTIAFYRRDHGDGYPFDGPGRTIAHAFAPVDGRFHYDADEQWSVGAVQGALDLQTTALHEIGHLLGLGHSEVEAAIMYPSITTGATKGLNQDDINGIRALYNS